MTENWTETSPEVAVVGAGPVGLLLAGELAQRGVHVAVFEQNAAATCLPKANGIVGRAVVELAGRGVFDGTGLRVISPPRFPFGPLTLDLGPGPENPLHIVPIPQRRLEEILEHRALEHGAQVRRGHELTGFDLNGCTVSLHLRHDERKRSANVSYLVGCDGARSTVRRQAGIGFPGFTSDDITFIARVRMSPATVRPTDAGLDLPGLGDVAAMRPNLFPGGSFTIAPAAVLDAHAPPDEYLVSTSEPRGEMTPSEEVSLEDLRASLRRVLGTDLPFTGATAVRSTVGNSRQADTYRIGRVFLAGDAAHIFNAGGSALNVGLLDALDLANRLCAVLRDHAPDSELDRYDATRRPAGERALRRTRAQAALSREDPGSGALRELIGELLTVGETARGLAGLLEEG